MQPGSKVLGPEYSHSDRVRIKLPDAVPDR